MAEAQATSRRSTAKPASHRSAVTRQRKPSSSSRGAALAARRDWRIKRNGFRTLGLGLLVWPVYGLYWFYITRSLVSEELGKSDNVGLQTIGLCVPILQVFVLYWLCRDISQLRKRSGLPGFSAAAYALVPCLFATTSIVLLIGFISAAVTYGATHPDPPVWAILMLILSLLLLLVAVILVPVFWGLTGKKLNEYWDVVSKGKATEAEFRGGEIVVIAIGLTLLVANAIAGSIGGVGTVHPNDSTNQPIQAS